MNKLLSARSLTIKSSILLVSLFTSLSYASLIPADLNITGHVEFDTDTSASILAGTQTGNLMSNLAGVVDSSSVNNTSVTGENPLGGMLTDIDDGVGAVAQVDGFNFGDTLGFIFDFEFALINNSLTDTFLATFMIDFSNMVDASGTDAYVDSEIALYDEIGTEFFFSDLTSDTLFGDENNGSSTGTFGSMINDSGMFSFDISLAAGESTSFGGVLKIDGADFDGNGGFTARSEAFVSVARVTNTSPPSPTPVPEPSSVLLYLIASLGLLTRKVCKSNF